MAIAMAEGTICGGLGDCGGELEIRAETGDLDLDEVR